MTASFDIAGPQRVLVFGASGTIGRAVVAELARAGHAVAGAIRPGTAHPVDAATSGFPTLGYRSCDIGDPASIARDAFAMDGFDVVVSCLASRTGTPRDAWAVDYRANRDILNAALRAGVRHFILLSAICVQRPRLAFQHAKLAFEAELAASGMTYSIVRPTAFFKSLSGQVERVRKGKPYMLFGDGRLTRCVPIADVDLARYIVECIADLHRHDSILPIGGPGPAISPLEQGERLFALFGHPPRFRSISPSVLVAARKMLGLGGVVSQWAGDKAEYARIAHYYATESMLVFDEKSGWYSEAATPRTGSVTLFDHYARLANGS